MKNSYTWSHVHLLSKICERVDDQESVTASWVDITEKHHKTTFPFTLWPLTYRTCDVTTSPAMCSPTFLAGKCGYDAKLYRCNEVVIVCFQDTGEREGEREGEGEGEGFRDKLCTLPCLAELDGAFHGEDGADELNHAENHSFLKAEPLLPCHIARSYNRLKTDVKAALYEIQENAEGIICTGHGSAAMLASCLASDMSRVFETERDFLGLDDPRVSVDFVGFSDRIIASPAYWEQYSSTVNEYICVVFEDSVGLGANGANGANELLKRNPRSRTLVLGGLQAAPNERYLNSRSASVFEKLRFRGKKGSAHSNARERDISDYVLGLQEKVTLPLS